MDSWKYIFILFAYLTIIVRFSVSHNDQDRGRKLFGGYQIVPKICQPTNPSRIKSNKPPICMFNYECSRRQGEVVGACMDGFLFGACCQLPSSSSSSSSSDSINQSEEIPPLIINEKLDHVPDIPILLNPNGTPIDGMAIDQHDTILGPASSSHSTSSQISELEQNFPAFLGSQSIIDDLSMPVLLSHSDANNDIQEQKETMPVINPVTTLLTPDQVLQIADPVNQLPGLFSQGFGPSNHSIAETILINKNGSLVYDTNNPDVLFKPLNRSTISPNYFTNTDVATTKMLPIKYMNTEKTVDTTTQSISTAELIRVPTITYETQYGNKKHDDEYDREEIAINHIISILNGTTSKTPSRIPTQHSENKPSSIHTWVTLDETSVPSTNSETLPYTSYKSSTKPANYYYYESGFTSTTESGMQSSPTRPSYSSYYTTINQKYPSTYGSSSSSYTISSKPTTLQPAPTVIVLGPFDTSGSTTDATTPKPVITHKPILSSSIRPNLLTKKPNMGTTITHNISTIILTDDTATASATSNIISTSYVNVKLKDPNTPSSITTQSETITQKPTTIWTTLSTWSSKPSFQLKPGKPEFDWPQQNLTPVHTLIFKTTQKPLTTPSAVDSDDGTAAPDELSNFPPDRNPNLTNSTPTSQQEKPTIIVTSNNTGHPMIEHMSENDIPTPDFIDDEVLKNKVDDFVNKIVDSLQTNFQDLKNVVYARKNITTSTTVSSTVVTQKPPSRKPTAKPSGTRKPTTKRPNISTKPGTIGSPTNKPVKITRLPKPTTPRPSSSINVTTKRTSLTTPRRPKPTKKIVTAAPQISTTPVSTTVQITTQETTTMTTSTTTIENNDIPTNEPNYRNECGIRPLIRDGRVVGGKGAKFGEWPWQVLVREATWLGLFTKNKCGGVLITENYVITAAHCQPGFLASLVAVFGEHDISGKLESRPSVTRNVKRVIVHRAYNPATFENDLALLELESPIEFDSHIVPICMPDDNADFTGRMATVTGWGRVKYNGGVPSILQEVKVPVMENAVCQDMFRTAGHSKLILDSFLCAGYANGQKDSCEGDSGGPLMMERPDGRWELVGTVSHGIKCAAPYLPGVYMRTTFFKPWLSSVTGV